MNKTIDYFIDSKKDLASFEYYFEEELNITSVTLKSIMFYIAHVDLKDGILYIKSDVHSRAGYSLAGIEHFLNDEVISLKRLCDYMNI